MTTLQRLVGPTFLQRINDHKDGPLRIGKRVWSTHELATQLGVVHTRAARLLTAAADTIGAKTVQELYAKSTPYTFAGVAGLGETTMYVLWRLFESNGLDPEKWADAGDSDDALVTFHTMKARELKAEARTKADAARRRRTQRRSSHEAAVAHVSG